MVPIGCSCLAKVTPFPAAGSAAAAKGTTASVNDRLIRKHPSSQLYRGSEAATGVFRPVPPLSSLSAVPQNAIFFGAILGVQRFCSKSLELVRRQEDIFNDLFGFGMIWPYYHVLLSHSERRLLLHNRIVGGSVVLAVAYANLLA
jgi:hypothetical protein